MWKTWEQILSSTVMPITIDGTWSPNKSGAICEIVDVILQYNGHAQCTQFVIVQWPIAHLAP